MLDPRTLSVLYKWLKNGTLSEIFGSISTGKEANVYYAYRKPPTQEETEKTKAQDEVKFEPHMSKKEKKHIKLLIKQRHDEKVAKAAINFDYEKDFAVKIFKTTVLVFRDRERYIEGEFRFRNARFKGNPMKMVKQWAEKEMRNLKRLKQAGLNVPEPYLLKNNIILMEFIGESGLAAPRLRDAGLNEDQMVKAYFEVLKIMRKLYQDCMMVHGDLSEYNMLYFKDTIYIIDVSQSVELDHPMALDFLRRDCVNINDYFNKQNVEVLSTEAAYKFITTEKVDATDDIDSYLRSILEESVAESNTLTADEKRQKDIDDKVFQNVEIPRSIHQINLDELHRLDEYEQMKILRDQT